MFKFILYAIAYFYLLNAVNARADQIFIPYIPGTNTPNYSAPRTVVTDQGHVYQTIPSTNLRDYNAGGGYVQQSYPQHQHQPQRAIIYPDSYDR